MKMIADTHAHTLASGHAYSTIREMAAAARAKEIETGTLSLEHIYEYHETLVRAGLHTGEVSPLLLPKYARHER